MKIKEMSLTQVNEKIQETKEQIRKTTSPYRGKDLKKYLSKLNRRKDELTHANNMGIV